MQKQDISEFKEFVQEHTLDDDGNYLGNALAGEVGEINNVLKRMHVKTKVEHYRKNLERDINAGITPTLEEHLEEEVGDVLFYLFAIMNKYNISLSDAIENQRNKIIGQSIAYQETFKK